MENFKQSTNIKTWINDLRAVSGAVRAADMSVATIGAVDYAKALDGLSLKQAKLMLTTQGMLGEEQKDLLVKQGLIATSERMSASLVSEALANNGLNKEKQEELLIDLGLMNSKTKELITENAVTEAKLRGILAEKGITGAKADTLIASILQTGANGTEAISWDVLTASIWANIKALAAWFVSSPVGWILMATGAVVGFIKVVDHFAITAEKLNDQLQELKATEEELISAQDKLTEIDNKIAEIQSKGTLSITDNADISRLEQEKLLLKDEIELLEKRKELQQDEYNKNAKKYADGEYSNYTHGQGDITHLMNSYKGYKAKSERTDIDDYFIEDAKKGLKETEAELIEYRNTINENLANLAPDDEESRKKLETIREAIEKLIYTEEELAKIKFDRFIIDPNNTGIAEGFEKIKSDGEVTTQEITELANKLPTLKKFMDDNGISAETLAAELNNVGTEAENSGENVNKTTDSYGALNTSLSAVVESEADLKTISDVVNGRLYLTNEEVAALTKKYPDLADKIKLTTKGWSLESGAMDIVEDSVLNLQTSYISAQNAISEALSSQMAQRINNLNSELLAVQTVAEAYAILAQSLTDDLGNHFTEKELRTRGFSKEKQEIIDFVAGLGQARESSAKALEKLKELQNAGLGKTSSKTSSKDNTPDYEDPTDARINRINLRSKELEQQEESIQNQIELAELEDDYQKQVSLTNDLIDTRKKRVDELNTANAGLHQMAENLRNSTPNWNEEEWFDSQGNATEAYYDLYNSSSKEEQEAIKNQFEIISKIKKAWVENDKELVELNKELLQDTENLNELYDKLANSQINDIKHQIMLGENNYGSNYNPTALYQQIQDTAHAEAERLRALDPEKYKEQIQEWQKIWWDAEESMLDYRWNLSSNWIDERNELGDWAAFDDNEVKAWQRVVNWLKTEYPHALDKIAEAEENLRNARKDEFGRATDFGSSYLGSRKSLLQSHFDVTNAIAEAQHEINKELETSLTLYEYLDEETRKLLFNQDDYNALSAELLKIENQANNIQARYENELLNATADTLDEITSKYEMQYETLMKSYEIAKADLEIAKKKAQLNNVLAERNVRQLVKQGDKFVWEWVADSEAVANAKSELADAEYARRTAEAGLTQTESINKLTAQQDALGTIINQFESGVLTLDAAVSDAATAIGQLPTAIEQSFGTISPSFGGTTASTPPSSNSSGSTRGSTSNAVNRWATTPDGNNVRIQIENGKTITSGLPVGTVIHTDGGDYEITGGNAGSYTSKKIDNIKWYASGTRRTQNGLAVIGENEPETYIDSNGRLIPINNPILSKIQAGGIVFNQDQMTNLRSLWDLSNLGKSNINSSLLGSASRNAGETKQYNIGDIIVNSPRDYNDFVRALTQRIKERNI